MLKIVLEIITIVLAIIGTADIIRFISWHFVSPKTDKLAYVVVLEDEDVEFKLRAAIERMKCDFSLKGVPLLAVDKGMDESERRVCNKIAQEHNIKVCSVEKIGDYLTGL